MRLISQMLETIHGIDKPKEGMMKSKEDKSSLKHINRITDHELHLQLRPTSSANTQDRLSNLCCSIVAGVHHNPTRKEATEEREYPEINTREDFGKAIYQDETRMKATYQMLKRLTYPHLI